MSTSPTLTLNNGVSMPALGLGVYQSSPEDTVDAVVAAIRAGYRLVDTAAAYGNEREVGEAIRRSGIDRSKLFVTTKLWISDYGHDEALHAFDVSLGKLGLDYVDLYLLHWPMPTEFDRTVAAYKAAETLLAQGRVRAIGVCNHSAGDLEQLISRTDVVPAVNQIELHPYFSQRAARDAGAAHGIVTQSWSPIGGVLVYQPENPDQPKNVLEDPVILAIAEKTGKTPAQVILRWQIESALAPIPKSVKKHRIEENINVFDFTLTPEDIAAIDALDTGERGGPDPALVNTTLFPFAIED
ncbi:aldo/keto reductase [Clavibacter michiganensis subsp. phaseoli]|uniref:Aldo/keto reductase n=1 Tax=Clavibacter phaseoli TaxID=1734031 RepID=A0A8I0SMR6_9MICO|nr:aldo/keto reductase [Clavibacter phaseoli]MBF4632594.1 aldo/keto reductase [Clavibacter phaseoli]